MRAIFTGNRTYANEEAIRSALRTLPEGSTVEIHPAAWDTYGPAAGPIRNQAMVEFAGADVCFAFGELQRMKRGKLRNTGTGDCVERCREAGIRVVHTP